jgi:hypothetical protein
MMATIAIGIVTSIRAVEVFREMAVALLARGAKSI